jgi:hypothetical protein
MTSLVAGKIEAYYELSPAIYCFLELLSIRQCVDPKEWAGLDLAMRLSSSFGSDAKRLQLDFTGVRDLKIGSLDGLMRYAIDIRSIAERQLEGLSYRVVEEEWGLVSFACADFAVKISG